MGKTHTDRDVALVARAVSGDPDGWNAFVARVSDTVYGLCAQTCDGDDIADAYVALFDRLSASNCALLADYNGRAPLNDYVVLKAGDLLAEHIVTGFSLDADRAWRAFERFFRSDIRKAIARRFAEFDAGFDVPSQDDVYQDICAALIENDYQRLKAYDGAGSFAGYLRRIVRNLLEDIARKAFGRRRLPKAVAAMGALEQQVFRMRVWGNAALEQVRREIRMIDGKAVDPPQLEAAIATISALGSEGSAERPRMEPLEQAGEDGEPITQPIADASPDPEAALLNREQEEASESASEALAQALQALPEEARLFLQFRYLHEPPLKPAEIAPLLGLPVKELYKRRAKWEKSLRDALAAIGIEKFPNTSV